MEKQGKNKNQHLLRGVKKTGGLLNSGFSIVKSSKLTTYILVLIVGIGLGYGGGRLLPSSSESDVKTKSSSLAAKPRAELTEKEKLQVRNYLNRRSHRCFPIQRSTSPFQWSKNQCGR